MNFEHFPPPPKDEVKPCPVCGKTDMVIPIAYGFPGPSMMEDSKKGELKLGGCLITDSDPEWYCKRDDKSFH